MWPSGSHCNSVPLSVLQCAAWDKIGGNVPPDPPVLLGYLEGRGGRERKHCSRTGRVYAGLALEFNVRFHFLLAGLLGLLPAAGIGNYPCFEAWPSIPFIMSCWASKCTACSEWEVICLPFKLAAVGPFLCRAFASCGVCSAS